jgi:hypothetical protein
MSDYLTPQTYQSEGNWCFLRFDTSADIAPKKHKPRKLAFPGFEISADLLSIDAVGAALEEERVFKVQAIISQ